MSKYCTCKERKLVDVTINHETIKVCSKRLGGCGKEYCEKGEVVAERNKQIQEFNDMLDAYNYSSIGITNGSTAARPRDFDMGQILGAYDDELFTD